MVKIITVFNKKGGVGKTITTLNLGAGLARLGKKVLLIDLNPTQANLTQNTIGRFKEIVGIESLLKGDATLDSVIRSTSIDNLHIIPAENNFGENLEQYLANAVGSQLKLQVILNNDVSVSKYDYILIDNGPDSGLLAINSLLCADFYFIPLKPGFSEIVGYDELIKLANESKKFNSKLQNLGVVLTMADNRLNVYKDTIQILENDFGSYVFSSHIRNNTKFSTLGSSKKTIFDVEKPNEKGHQDYLNLSKEFISRIEGGVNGK